MRDQGWNYEFTASFLEIYNENLHDLISEGAGDKIEIKLVNEKRREVKYGVYHNFCTEVAGRGEGRRILMPLLTLPLFLTEPGNASYKEISRG